MTINDLETLRRRQIHDLLYMALIEIRQLGGDLKSRPVFGLANLLHNVPLELEQVAKREMTYEELFDSPNVRAKQSKCQKWLDDQIKWLETHRTHP